MDRILNYAFGFIIIYLFVLIAGAEEHIQILIGLLGALILSFAGFIISWLTLDGAQAAFVTGLAVFGLGGIPAAVIILTFFITGTLLTILNEPAYGDDYGDVHPHHRKRRNGAQVWSNSFWFVLFIILWFIFRADAWLIASLAALATAMSDTWSTEIGYHISIGSTYMIKGFRKVQPGTDGGISITGSLAGLAGGLLVGGLAYLLYPQIGVKTGLIIGVIGFIGNYVDSLLGAYFQYEGQQLDFPLLGISNFSLSNNGVNWAATGFGSLSSLILIHLLSIS